MKNKTDRDRFSSGDFLKKLHLELRVPLWVFGLFKVWDYAPVFCCRSPQDQWRWMWSDCDQLRSPFSRPGFSDEAVTRVFVGLFRDFIVLAHAFVTSCLDCCDELSLCIKQSSLNHTHPVWKSAARLQAMLPFTSTHICPVKAISMLLPRRFQIEFKSVRALWESANHFAPECMCTIYINAYFKFGFCCNDFKIVPQFF